MRKIQFVILAVMVAYGSLWADAASDDAPPAPVPVQITSGKKVFISNAQGESTAATAFPNQTYNDFYAAMKDWGRYDLVSTPEAADLIFEVRFLVTQGAVWVSQGNGGSSQDSQVRLVILDPKTHVVLWAFTEQIKASVSVGQERKSFREAVVQLVTDVKDLGVKVSP
jgi:hypothetical protein